MTGTRGSRPVRPWRLLAALLWAAAIWTFSSLPEPPGAGTLTFPHVDKVAHAGLYFVQAALLRAAGLRGVVAVALAILWGGIDEVHQSFVPGRAPDLLDLAADAVGAVLGAAAVGWSARRARGAR